MKGPLYTPFLLSCLPPGSPVPTQGWSLPSTLFLQGIARAGSQRTPGSTLRIPQWHPSGRSIQTPGLAFWVPPAKAVPPSLLHHPVFSPGPWFSVSWPAIPHLLSLHPSGLPAHLLVLVASKRPGFESSSERPQCGTLSGSHNLSEPWVPHWACR